MKNLFITKIALALSAIAVVFSIITLVRSISEGQLVFAAVLQLTGSVLIVGVCLINIYLTKHTGSDTPSHEESTEEHDEGTGVANEDTQEPADEDKTEETEETEKAADT